VGVSAEHKVDCLTCGESAQGPGEIGRVAEQEDGLARDIAHLGRNGEVGSGMAADWIVEACKPDTGVAAFERYIAVAQNGDAVISQCMGDRTGADKNVMVAENSIDATTLEPLQNIRTLPRRANGEASCAETVSRRVSDIVAGEEDDVGTELVDMANGVVKKEWLGEFVEVNVADLGDLQAIEMVRKPGDEDIAARDFKPVAFEFA
jgi:hypothetical protein